MEVIDFELMKYIKESNDEFLDLVGVIEKHFNFSTKQEDIFKRIIYTSKYIANLFFYALPNVKDKAKFKPIIINIYSELIKILEDKDKWKELKKHTTN